jgi:Tol biopolymer transport system component
LIGLRLGPYEITAKLGEGGMGVVFKAKDSQLGREVALKVLPEGFTGDPERLSRFEREAKLLAQLNHPNIAQIYGFEASGDTRALVMELVDGPTLAERLEAGPLPIHESLAVSLQIARALEEAHEKGIVHRDLKPQNIKASVEGKVKVLDFGLAKAMDPTGTASGGPSASQLAMSPTITLGATAQGVILGTAAYMAPEQARGLPVDKRADIWALGVVLYEMLTGRTVFASDTVPDTLAAVLTREVDWSALPPATPPAIRRLLRRCLERNPKNRLHDVADARIVLEEVAAGRVDEGSAAALPGAIPSAAPSQPLARRALPWLAGLALGAGAIAVVDRTLLAPAPVEPPRFVALTHSGKDVAPAASPDGRAVAFTSTRDGRSRIWLKQLATGEEVALTSGPADSGAVYSPDGSSLLFLRGVVQPYQLFRVSAVGGEPRRLADGVYWGAWSPDGRTIAVTRPSTAAGLADSVALLDANGGGERTLAKVDDVALVHLAWSPDGRAIGAWTQLRTNYASQQSVVAFDAANGARRTLYRPPPSTLIYGWAWNGPDELIVAESVTQSGRSGSRVLRVRPASGEATTLVWLRQPATRLEVLGPGRLVLDQAINLLHLAEWPLAAAGNAAPPAAEPRRWLTLGASADRQPVYSRDGRRVVFTSDRGGNLDLWEIDLATSAVRRLSDSPRDDWDPAFTADGQRLLWSSNRGGNYEVWTSAADGSGARQLTADGVDAENPTATPDDRWIVYASANPAAPGIWRIRADGTGAERLAAGAMSVPELSPDGRLVSFVDLDTSRLLVAKVADGEIASAIELPSLTFTLLQPGRSRWIPGSSTLVWLDYDQSSALTRLVAQEIVPGRDNAATRRTLLTGSADEILESFGISPDGRHLVVAVLQPRSELLLVEGLPGIGR